ncbi:MAG: SPOR domain-containing protein, partial [Sphingomicrobium sp.]
WDQARIIAAQDVPANQLDQRIDQWMQLATPKHASDQVAALVGVTPAAADAGQPVQLALNPNATRLADAAPAPQPEKPVVEAAAVAPAPAPIAAVAPSSPPAQVTMATIAATAVAEAKSVLASILPHGDVTAPKPAAKAQRAQQPAARRGSSPAVVQLGSYGSPERVLTAWNGAAHKFGALKAYAPMSAKFASPKGTFYRLSVRGFDSVGQASALCNSLRRQGGACFVRNSAGDVPVQIASR